jgi:hypothetical protein
VPKLVLHIKMHASRLMRLAMKGSTMPIYGRYGMMVLMICSTIGTSSSLRNCLKRVLSRLRSVVGMRFLRGGPPLNSPFQTVS